MRIIPEHELAPDDNPCEDCNRIRVTPITITDAEWDEISDSYNVYRNGLLLKGHTTCVTFAYWLKCLISLTGEGKV